MTVSNKPDPIVVNFSVGLDTEIRETYQQVNADGDYAPTGPFTLLDAIVAEAAHQLVTKIIRDSNRYGEMREAVSRIRAEMIRERIAPMLDEVFDKPAQLTNGYGERTGKEVTLRELVIEAARKEMKHTNARSDYDRTAFDKALATTVPDVLTKELSAEIAEAKKTLRTQIREASMSAIAAAITKQIAPA